MITGTCRSCRKMSHPFQRMGVCFDSLSPAKTFLSLFYEHYRFHFVKDIAASIVVQLERLQFPSFQLITTIPYFFRNPQNQIAQELSKMLQIPFKSILKRNFTPYPSFTLKKKCNIINQVVLLLDLAMENQEAFRASAWALNRGMAENIYGMRFCNF